MQDTKRWQIRSISLSSDDSIDIGAFAKPAAGKTYGETLYRQRMHITQHNSAFTFTTAQLPDETGIGCGSLFLSVRQHSKHVNGQRAAVVANVPFINLELDR